MNERFFSLPTERQDAIVNAGFKVFCASDYKHASMSAIADAGNISKSLLFHYFGNKAGLYMHLWQHAAETTVQSIRDFDVLATNDPFEILLQTTRAKCNVMKTHPYLFAFATRAYYEEEPHVKTRIQRDIERYTHEAQVLFDNPLCEAYLAQNVNSKQLFQDFLLLSEGYMLQKYRSGEINAETIETEMTEIIARWKLAFGRKDEQQ